MALKTWTLIDPARGVVSEPPDAAELGLENASVSRRTLKGGVREGVELIEVRAGVLRYTLLPQRGMGIWKAWLGQVEIGWQSPAPGPVHPQFVPVADPGGLGWLEGFDELLCRCGLVSNGAPEFDANGRLLYPLHGRIANLPAHSLDVLVDREKRQIGLRGSVDETRFLVHALRLTSTIWMTVGETKLIIVDEVTNLSAKPAEFELLYHINLGPPLLEEGSRVLAPIQRLAPRDARAAAGAGEWSAYAAPQAGFAEQVYYCRLHADAAGHTQAVLQNRAGNLGLAVRFDHNRLPCFAIWKNTAAAQDGYVTGLEPATNFPNVRSFEKAQGRVPTLAPGETFSCELELEVCADQAAVSRAAETIAQLQSAGAPQIFDRPQPGWSPI